MYSTGASIETPIICNALFDFVVIDEDRKARETKVTVSKSFSSLKLIEEFSSVKQNVDEDKTVHKSCESFRETVQTISGFNPLLSLDIPKKSFTEREVTFQISRRNILLFIHRFHTFTGASKLSSGNLWKQIAHDYQPARPKRRRKFQLKYTRIREVGWRRNSKSGYTLLSRRGGRSRARWYRLCSLSYCARLNWMQKELQTSVGTGVPLSNTISRIPSFIPAFFSLSLPLCLQSRFRSTCSFLSATPLFLPLPNLRPSGIAYK